jgi:hypothetical protein
MRHKEGVRQVLELKEILRNVLEEARMVLPGIQALFGFQLVAVFSAGFETISSTDKYIHLGAILLTICAIGCLIAPASYHRQVEHDTVSREFVGYASNLLCLGMIPLLISTCLDIYVVTNTITHSSTESIAAAGAAFLLLFTLWFVIPQIQRRKKHSEQNPPRASTKQAELEHMK